MLDHHRAVRIAAHARDGAGGLAALRGVEGAAELGRAVVEEVDAEAPATPKRSAGPVHGYEINETVRVKEGPFADFSGEIIEINEDQLKVKVLVNIFGRETPVELEFAQVAKL